MALGLHAALQEDANELLRDHEEEKKEKKRRKSLSVGEQSRPDLASSLGTTSAPATPVSKPAAPHIPTNPLPVPSLPTVHSTSPAEHGSHSRTASGTIPTPSSRPQTQSEGHAPDPAPAQEPTPPPPSVVLPPKTIAFATPDNPKPPRAMSSIYGKRKTKVALPGDLGPNDPRRKKTPTSKSQSPSSRVPYLSTEGAARRRASDITEMPHLRPTDDKGLLRLEKDKDDGAVDSSGDEGRSTDSDNNKRARGRTKARSRSPDPPRVSRSDSEGSDTEKTRLDYVGATKPSDIASHHDDATVARDTSEPATSPKITVTAPITADYFARQKRSVHPHSAYDHAASNVSTPMASDEEEHLSDVRRAQRLTLTISPIHSAPDAHRVIRQVIRGNYSYFQHEAEEGRRRQRVYLVATDLSPEAEYALEWTIGTILRDGDTLLALYAVDEEGGASGSDGVEIGHGAEAVRDTANIVHSLPAEKVGISPLRRAEPLFTKANELPQGKSKAEHQRFQAAESISDRCIRLLRKTKLQVRVVVEVFHCKSPRHMITEVVRCPVTCISLNH